MNDRARARADTASHEANLDIHSLRVPEAQVEALDLQTRSGGEAIHTHSDCVGFSGGLVPVSSPTVPGLESVEGFDEVLWVLDDVHVEVEAAESGYDLRHAGEGSQVLVVHRAFIRVKGQSSGLTCQVSQNTQIIKKKKN